MVALFDQAKPHSWHTHWLAKLGNVLPHLLSVSIKPCLLLNFHISRKRVTARPGTWVRSEMFCCLCLCSLMWYGCATHCALQLLPYKCCYALQCEVPIAVVLDHQKMYLFSKVFVPYIRKVTLLWTSIEFFVLFAFVCLLCGLRNWYALGKPSFKR